VQGVRHGSRCPRLRVYRRVNRCAIGSMAAHQLVPGCVDFKIVCQPDRSAARDGYRATSVIFPARLPLANKLPMIRPSRRWPDPDNSTQLPRIERCHSRFNDDTQF